MRLTTPTLVMLLIGTCGPVATFASQPDRIAGQTSGMAGQAIICYASSLEYFPDADARERRAAVSACLSDPGAVEALPEKLSDILNWAPPGYDSLDPMHDGES